MVKDKWWKAAAELKVGDILETADGQCQIVKSITVEEKAYPITTYNLSVEDNHTFFVGKLGVLTHNTKGFVPCDLGKEVISDSTKVVKKARYGEQKISNSLYSKLRKKTPSSEIRDMVNEGVKLPMKDFALPGKTITTPLEADHIVPMKKIACMENFEKLTYEEQLEVLNYKDNFIGLSKSANTSKGSKSYEEWIVYKKENIKIDEQFRNKMIKLEKELGGEIQELIDKFISK